MTDRELEQLLRARYAGQVPESETAPGDLRVSVAAIPATAPAPLRPLSRRRNYSLLAVAAVLLIGGAMAAGSGLVQFSVVPPAPSDALLVSPGPSTSETPPETPMPTPTPNLRVGGLIAYTKSTRRDIPENLWIVGSDGRGAHPLLADPKNTILQGWSPDGADVLYQDHDAASSSSKLYLTDSSGGEPQLVETGCVPTASSWCQDREVAFSADGRSIAFIRSSNIVENGNVVGQRNVVVTMDLASGRTSELNATAPFAARPGWSPDGRHIVYTRWGIGFTDTLGQFVPEEASIWSIDPDGQNARQVNPAELMAYEAAWSPNGARIVFESSTDEQRDLYTIGPDGTNVRRLTTDGLSQSPTWTADGRILFTRRAGSDGDDAAGWWVMDADGSNAVQVMSADAIGVPPENLSSTRPIWQPLGGAAIVPPPYGPGEAAVIGSPAPTPIPPASRASRNTSTR